MTGSLVGADIVLTAAYHEQFYDLGWYHCSLGQISKKWHQAVEEYNRRDNLSLDSSSWASSLIQLFWSYTKNLWQHRNEFIHGSTPEEEATKLLAKLHDQVSYHYAQFSRDPTYILPRHHHLFPQRTLQDRLTLSYDHLQCWLRSVDEARNILSTQEAHLRSTSS